MNETVYVRAEPITRGPKFHFFGYYDKTPWDVSGRYVLALETDFMDRRPGPEDTATVGMVDLEDGNRFVPLGETRAWNWQQGCMLQWLPNQPDTVVYNDREGDGAEARFVARLLNVRTGARRTLPLPIYAVSPTGEAAISLSFSRLFDVRPGYGYAGVPDPWGGELCPDADGLWRVDLRTGESRLILSLADARDLGPPKPGMDTGKHRFNHAQWAPDGGRFAVLHRWSVDREANPARAPWLTRLLTLSGGPNVGGGGDDVFILSDDDMVSHYDWRDGASLLAWARQADTGNHYYLFHDRTRRVETVGGDGTLTVDGHCSYSPDRNRVLTDTYPDKDGYRTLLLFHPATGRRVDIGRFHGPTPPDGEIRCDLHPRWSRDGRHVSIDSIHEGGARQMYRLDVTPFVLKVE